MKYFFVNPGSIKDILSNNLKKISILLWIIFLLFSTNPAMAELKIDSVFPNVGLVGEELRVNIKGEGFTTATRASMSLDSGNTASIVGSFNTPGSAYGISLSGDIAYVADYSDGLQILDLSDPSNPFLIGSVDTPGMANDLIVAGDIAYVADGEYGVQVINISAPSSPLLITIVDTPGVAKCLSIAGDILYVADDSEGLQVIDVSDPSNPLLIGSVDTLGIANCVTVTGDIAYVTDGDGMKIINVSTPSNPFIIGNVDTPGLALDVVVSSDMAYVADGYDGGLQVIDVSDPTSPFLVASVNTMGIAYSIKISGDSVYIADYSDGLLIIDVTDPSSPLLSGSVDTPGLAFDLAISGDIAYMADGANGVQIIDVSDPSTSLVIGSVDTPNYASGLNVAGDIAYVADRYSGMQVVDLSDPSNPLLIGSVDTSGIAYKLTVAGGMAYVADGSTGGLQIFDVSDPGNPLLIGGVNTPGNAVNVEVVGNIAYVADYSEGLQIVDVSIPSNPSIIGSVDTPGNALGVTVVGNTAYIADGSVGGLQIINVSTPSNPLIIGNVDTPGIAYGVTVAGNLAYVAAGSVGGLQIIDISTPSNPLIIGSLDIQGYALDVEVTGNMAYVANSSNGVQVVDVSNPSNPLEVGSVDTPGSVWGLKISDDIVYVADGESGLIVVPIPVELDPITFNNSTSITVTIPAIFLAGNYNMKLFDESEEDNLVGAVTFMEMDSYLLHQKKKAIVIAGGGPNISNGILWDETKLVTNQAYLALNRQGYEPDQIYLLSDEEQDPDGDGISNVTGASTLSSLENALDWANDSSELILFMTDHGGNDTMQLSSSEVLSATTLNNLLNDLQDIMEGRVILIYDACYSGSFADNLVALAGQDRVIMTSSLDSERAWFYNGGVGSFSFQFWSSAYLTGNLYDSFSNAKDMVTKDQTPLLDVNGDGVPNSKSDYNLAVEMSIGRGAAAISAPPWIGGIISSQTISNGSELTLWADRITSLTTIANVWAIIIPPSLTGLSTNIPITDDYISRVELSDSDGDGSYEGPYIFSENGTYRVIINVIDSDNYQAMPLSLEVTVTDGSDPGGDTITDDGFNDNSAATAANIDITGTIQKRNFYSSGDTDWIKFNGISGYYYNIETTSLGSNADTVISIYDADGITRLHKQDDQGAGQDEILSWQASASGIYYVKISQYDPDVYGSETSYSLKIYLPSMLNDGILLGTTSTNDGTALSQVYLEADSSLCNPVFSLADGSYLMPCSAGSYTVTAELNGYETNSHSVTIEAEGNTLTNFILSDSSSDSCQKATLTSPSETTTDASSTFTWVEDPQATWYQLWIGTSSGSKVFDKWYKTVDICSSGNCSAILESGLLDGSYKWWIQSWNDNSNIWSDSMTFTVGSDSSAATLISPDSSASNQIAFTWNAVSGSTWYQLWVDDSTGNKIKKWYTAAQAGCETGSTCSVTNSTTLTGNSKWWVQTYSDNGNGDWSDGMSFTVSGGDTPSAVTLTSPSGSTSNTTPTYTWNAVSSSTWYQLWVNDSTGTPIKEWYTSEEAGCESGTGNCSITPTEMLEPGSCTWWVRGWNNDGNGDWSDGMSFTVSD